MCAEYPILTGTRTEEATTVLMDKPAGVETIRAQLHRIYIVSEIHSLIVADFCCIVIINFLSTLKVPIM